MINIEREFYKILLSRISHKQTLGCTIVNLCEPILQLVGHANHFLLQFLQCTSDQYHAPADQGRFRQVTSLRSAISTFMPAHATSCLGYAVQISMHATVVPAKLAFPVETLSASEPYLMRAHNGCLHEQSNGADEHVHHCLSLWPVS